MTNTEQRELIRLWRAHLAILLDRIPPDPPLLQSTEERRAEIQIRNARWLLEQATPVIAAMTNTADAIDAARELLGQIGGEYREGEEVAFDDVEQHRLAIAEP